MGDASQPVSNDDVETADVAKQPVLIPPQTD